jgi:acetylornithine deacetylase/succinyl-diaminopimelate desuccinylase-like protein
MDLQQMNAFASAFWQDEVLPVLTRYVAIPNKSPAFDPDWEANGHMEEAVSLLSGWAEKWLPELPGARLEVLRLPGRTPVILIDVPGEGSTRTLLYGHLDKQPEMTGWSEGLGPWTPVLRGDKLYGRGGADDGYALFGIVTALLALNRQGIARGHCVVVIEASEESSSEDLPAYMEAFADRIGSPDLVVCLDSGCGNYDQLWLTTSLRGLVSGLLTVEILTEGVHSGDASGVVPSSFRIARSLVSRIEDEASGRIIAEALGAEIPGGRIEEARRTAAVLGNTLSEKFPFVEGARAVDDDQVELALNRTWRPALELIGAAGLPDPASAGNVLRPSTALKLSFRLPPTLDADKAAADLARILTDDPPYGAKVTFEAEQAAGGWNAPPLAPWLFDSLDRASQATFGRPVMMMGEGGSIPFMGMLGAQFPEAQFVITGVLGPHSNAHGPNEFLHIPTARKVSIAVAAVLADQHRQNQ